MPEITMFAFHISALLTAWDGVTLIIKTARGNAVPNLPAGHEWLYNSRPEYQTAGCARRTAREAIGGAFVTVESQRQMIDIVERLEKIEGRPGHVNDWGLYPTPTCRFCFLRKQRWHALCENPDCRGRLSEQESRYRGYRNPSPSQFENHR